MIRRVWVLFAVEWGKLRRQAFPLVCTLAIAAAAGLTALLTAGGSQNGFDSLARCLKISIPLAAIFLVALGALQFSSEASLGTLRLVLPRPFHRGEWVLARGLVLAVFALVLVVGIVGIASLVVGSVHGFADIRDPHFDVVHRLRGQMMREVALAVGLVLPPLVAAALFGLLCSVLMDNAGIAVAVATVLYLVLDAAVGIAFHRPGPYQGLPLFFSCYLSWPLDALDQFSRGIYTYKWKQLDVLLNVTVPAVYASVLTAAAWLWFRRKDVLV